MKFIAATLIALSSFSAFSAGIDTTIAKIEAQKDAVCSRTSISAFNFCTGPATYEARLCYYSVKYTCYSTDGDFSVKLRVRESSKGTKVTKVSYLK